MSTNTIQILQVQRENLEKENGSLKADLEQLHGLQEQYEQLQEKVSKCILIHTYETCMLMIYYSILRICHFSGAGSYRKCQFTHSTTRAEDCQVSAGSKWSVFLLLDSS